MRKGLFVWSVALGAAASLMATAWQTAYPTEEAAGFTLLTEGATPYLYCDRLLWANDSATVMVDVAAEASASGTVLAVGSSSDTDSTHELYAKNRICLALDSGQYVLRVGGEEVGRTEHTTRPGRRTVALTMARAANHVTAFRLVEDGIERLRGNATLESGGLNSLCFGSDFGSEAASGVAVFAAQVCRAEGSLTEGIPADEALALIGISPDWRAFGDAAFFTVRDHDGTPFHDAGSAMVYADGSGALAFAVTTTEEADGTLLSLGYANTDNHALGEHNRVIVAISDGLYSLRVRNGATDSGASAVSASAIGTGKRNCLLTVARTANQSVTARLFVEGELQCEVTHTIAAGPLNAICLGSDFGAEALTGATVGNGMARWASGTLAGLASVPDAEAALRDPFDFEITDGTATITAYRGAGVGSVALPETVPDTDIPVTALADGLFAGRTGLTAVTLPPSLTTIGDRAFSGCTALAAVAFPDSMERIGDEAFLKCFALSMPAFPTGLREIGAQAFGWCQGMVGALTLPGALETLGESAFTGCSGLTAVSADGIRSVPPGAFSGCLGLTEVALPAAQTIGRQAFQRCVALGRVACPTAQTVGRQAFHGCRALASVTLSPTADAPAYGTFAGCAALPTDEEGFRYLDDTRRVLLGMTQAMGGTLRVPEGVRIIHSATFGPAAADAEEIVLPESVASIGDDAFYGCRGARFRFLGEAPPADVRPWAFPTVTGGWTLPAVPGMYPRGADAWEALGAATWHGLTLSPFSNGYRLRVR